MPALHKEQCFSTDLEPLTGGAGRGKCINYFCQCEPPYFSLGCSRSKAYPPGRVLPSPTQLKIYM